MLYTNILRQNFELEQTKFPILLFTYNVSLNMSEERFLICTKPLIYHLCRKKIFCAINKQIDFFYKYVRKCLCKETWLLIVACVQLPSNWNEKKTKLVQELSTKSKLDRFACPFLSCPFRARSIVTLHKFQSFVFRSNLWAFTVHLSPSVLLPSIHSHLSNRLPAVFLCFPCLRAFLLLLLTTPI